MFGLAFGVMWYAIVVPAGISSGSTFQTLAATVIVTIMWLVIRAMFGEDEADEYREKLEEQQRQRQKRR